uniref:Uncharacterized protein n=1 Tax=Arundo donax TaxID=35708 RepID=A0A0A8ZHL9_ARUDO
MLGQGLGDLRQGREASLEVHWIEGGYGPPS